MLLDWYDLGHRDLPWRRTSDPYRIWLSETMLQQTRASAAIPYYERFLERFPNVEALAQAPESEVLAMWSGLGYYHRARNLLKAAREIDEMGSFPQNYERIRALPGVGDYTAAAVGSIAFGLPHAVLDGNVVRVVARIAAQAKTRREFQETVDAWLAPERPGDFNQAMMELGATVCLPRNPMCLVCPVEGECEARATGRQAEFPVKAQKAPAKAASSDLVVMERAGAVLMRQRAPDLRLMAGFWELPECGDFPGLAMVELGSFRHSIVVTRWEIRVFRAKPVLKKATPAGLRWLKFSEFKADPITTVTRKALRLAGLGN